jgi:uncharacterized repeat protein (TIGR01451 family)
VYLGNGDGTFQPAVYYTGGMQPMSVTVADVNGDGKLDVVAANPALNTLSVLLGNGDGTLQAPTSISSSGDPQSLVAGDFNADGRTDLAVANFSSGVTVFLGVLTPTLTVSSSHTDPFAIGQTGDTYTISVANTGPGATSGTVTVNDTLPAGLTATAIQGTGWNCNLSNLTCTNSNQLPAGQSYSFIVVSVTATTIGTGANQLTVSGGSAAAASASDPTSIVGPAVTVQTSPSGLQFTIDNGAAQIAPQSINLTPGTHTIAVASPQTAPGTQYIFTGWSDSGAASHTITVSGPATYTATFQTQYLLTTAAYPQSGGSVSPPSGTYYNAGTPVTLTATPISPLVFAGWSGGAPSASNPQPITLNAPLTVTAIFDVPGATCTMTGDATASVADVQFIVNEALGIVPANNDLNADGVVNIADVQKVIDAALNFGCH